MTLKVVKNVNKQLPIYATQHTQSNVSIHLKLILSDNDSLFCSILVSTNFFGK